MQTVLIKNASEEFIEWVRKFEFRKNLTSGRSPAVVKIQGGKLKFAFNNYDPHDFQALYVDDNFEEEFADNNEFILCHRKNLKKFESLSTILISFEFCWRDFRNICSICRSVSNKKILFPDKFIRIYVCGSPTISKKFIRQLETKEKYLQIFEYHHKTKTRKYEILFSEFSDKDFKEFDLPADAIIFLTDRHSFSKKIIPLYTVELGEKLQSVDLSISYEIGRKRTNFRNDQFFAREVISDFLSNYEKIL